MDDPLDTELAEFNLSLMTRKKKKAKKSLEVLQEEQPAAPPPGPEEEWTEYSYLTMLSRAFTAHRENHPELAKAVIIPVPVVERYGTKKSRWNNFEQFCLAIHRGIQHVETFIFAELACTGSLEAGNRLVLKGRHNARNVELVARSYIRDYVKCGECGSMDTVLTRDSVTRLTSVDCDQCKSKRTVKVIKQGFVAILKGDRKKAKINS
jgi:translation initiation factor 2 subunit 2